MSSNIEDENGLSSSDVEDGMLFLHKKDEPSTNTNVHPTAFDWDDTFLNKAYDDAINKTKKQLLNEMETEMEITSAEIKNVLNSDTNSNVEKIEKKSKKKINTKWKVGSACRTIYSEDGEEYEAVITEMLDSASCIVKFIGYDNEEEVLLKDLAPSLGKEVVQLQMEDAEVYNSSLEEGEINSSGQTTELNPQMSTEPRRSKKRKPVIIYPRTFHSRPMCYHSPIPPPPPPPFRNQMTGPKNAKKDESQNAMMLSWYMCGYYTGYYQRYSEEQQSD